MSGTVPKDTLPPPLQPPDVDKFHPATGKGVVDVRPPQQSVIGPPTVPYTKPAKQGKL